MSIVSGLDVKRERKLLAEQGERSRNAGRHRFAIAEAGRKFACVGNREYGSGVRTEHPGSHVSVAEALVAGQRCKVYLDREFPSIESHLAREGVRSHYGVVGNGEPGELLFHRERRFGLSSHDEHDSLHLTGQSFVGLLHGRGHSRRGAYFFLTGQALVGLLRGRGCSRRSACSFFGRRHGSRGFDRRGRAPAGRGERGENRQ